MDILCCIVLSCEDCLLQVCVCVCGDACMDILCCIVLSCEDCQIQVCVCVCVCVCVVMYAWTFCVASCCHVKNACL